MTSIILFLVVLLVLVLAHEFGHFIVAKKSGMRVDEFAFGFPPRLFTIKRGETNYSFNALPLGGYVKIYGENPDDVTDNDRSRSFGAQSRFKQALVVIAGIVFNLILAWFLISATLMIGINASASDAGPGYPVSSPKLMVTDLTETSPARAGGIEAGDILLRVSDGTETVEATSPDAVSNFIRPHGGVPVTVTYVHEGETHDTTILPVTGITDSGAAIGIYMDMIGKLQLPIHRALWEGGIKTYQYTALTVTGIYGFLYHAIVGHADFSQVAGPVGIVQAVGNAAGIGFSNLLLFTALISINLAVINVLPFPALDGGRLLFVIIEAIMRRPITPRIANAFNITGFALLMLLMILVTWHDIAKIIAQ